MLGNWIKTIFRLKCFSTMYRHLCAYEYVKLNFQEGNKSRRGVVSNLSQEKMGTGNSACLVQAGYCPWRMWVHLPGTRQAEVHKLLRRPLLASPTYFEMFKVSPTLPRVCGCVYFCRLSESFTSNYNHKHTLHGIDVRTCRPMKE